MILFFKKGLFMSKISVFLLFLKFLKERKKWYLFPIVLILLVLSVVVISAEGSAIAPFIYAIF